MIAGGKDKGIPYDEIGSALAEHVKVLILIGATSSQYFLNISAIWSVKRYSNPDIPRISLNFLISFLILIQLVYYFLK